MPDPFACSPGADVVGSQDPQLRVEDLPEFGLRLGGLALGGERACGLVPGGFDPAPDHQLRAMISDLGEELWEPSREPEC